MHTHIYIRNIEFLDLVKESLLAEKCLLVNLFWWTPST